MTKNTLARAAVQLDVETNAGGGNWRLKGVLFNGFNGYANWSEVELRTYLSMSDVTADSAIQALSDELGEF